GSPAGGRRTGRFAQERASSGCRRRGGDTRQEEETPMARLLFELAGEWKRLAGPGEGAASVGAELLARWAEPHRRYHTLDHLKAVLAAVAELADAARDVDLVRYAAWFHDAVYRGEPGADEENSAQLAELL